MLPNVTIIILNWNGWKDTIRCLESLLKINYTNYNFIIVDNGSTDDSIKKIKDYCKGEIPITSKFLDYNSFNKPIEIIECDKNKIETGKNFKNLKFHKNLLIIENRNNHGFAGGNNIAIKYLIKNVPDLDYILLLNNDTIVEKNFLYELIKTSENDKNVGIVGPKIYTFDKNEIIKDKVGFTGSNIHFYLGGFPKGLRNLEKPIKVDMVSGACILIKKELIKKIGMLDPIYFFGIEDADYCITAAKKGYKVLGVPKAEIWHEIGGSHQITSNNYSFILSEGIKNHLIFMSRHASITQKILSMVFLLLYYIFLIFKSENLKEMKIKAIAIKKGINNFFVYKNNH